MCVLICTEIAYLAKPGGTGRREEYFLWRIDSGGSPTDSRGGTNRFKRCPHNVCGVALCSMWHFALRVDTGDSPTDSRGGPHHVCGVALCSMWHFALSVDTGGSPIDSRGGPHRFTLKEFVLH